MALSIMAARAYYEPLRSLGFASIGAGYTKVGTPLLNPVRILSIYNGTDANMIFSLDGVTDHIISFAGTGKVYDETTNKGTGGEFFIPQGTQFWVKEELAVSTMGNVYIEVQYGLALQP